jgi:hypothetical protein
MMAYRYTQRDLDGAVRGLNLMAGFTADEADAPLYTREGAEYRAMVGRYTLQGAYGGFQVQQIINEGGGVRAITQGYLSKREVYHLIHAYREGMAAGGVGDRYTLEALRAEIPAYRAERAAYAAKVEAAREKVGL